MLELRPAKLKGPAHPTIGVTFIVTKPDFSYDYILKKFLPSFLLCLYDILVSRAGRGDIHLFYS